MRSSNRLILYLCNGKDPKCCNASGCHRDCFHTSKVKYAINDPKMDPTKDIKHFRKYITPDGDIQFWERRLSCTAQTADDEPK